MEKFERRIRSLAASLATAALLAAPANLAARSATAQEPPQQEQQEQQEQGQGQASEPSTPERRPAPRALPQVTGTVLTWNGYRIDLRTSDGKTQQVAVNEETERLVEIERGAEVTVEYRRKIGDFVIAERVRSVVEAGTEAQPGTGTAPATVTGTVVSWTEAVLVLRTDEGDVTLFLSPRTEYLVKPLQSGLPVTVEYRETSNDARLATRVRAAGKENAPEPSQKPANP